MGTQHRISAHCHAPQPAALLPPAMAGNPLAVEPTVSADALAVQLAAVPSETNPYLSSGSMYGDGDWLAEGIKSHRSSHQSPSVQHSSHQALGSVDMHSSLQHPEGLQEQQAVSPVIVSSKPILGNNLQHGSGQHQDNSCLQNETECFRSGSPDKNLLPGTAERHEPSKDAVTPFSTTTVASIDQRASVYGAVQQYNSGPIQQASASQEQVSHSRHRGGDDWKHVAHQRQTESVQSGLSQALSPARQTTLPATAQVHAAHILQLVTNAGA